MELPPQQLGEIAAALRKQGGGGAGTEKRRATRVLVAARAGVLDEGSGREFSAVRIDVALGGMRLMEALKLQKGGRFVVSVTRKGGGALLVHCEVAHAREVADGVWVVGSKFVTLLEVRQPSEKAVEMEALRIRQRMLD